MHELKIISLKKKKKKTYSIVMTFMFLIETFDPLMQGCSISPTPITFAMISRHYKDVDVIIFIYNNNIMHNY